jgi:16S rRNA (guanine966-N2)-methyltransferase
LRPTPDRVRETLFNWLGQDLTGWRVLDAFAGSGALGLEAGSRGAKEVLLLEREAVLARHLRDVLLRLGAVHVRVQQADALAWMAAATPQSLDLILLDPPFDAKISEAALRQALPLLSLGGMIYLESGEPISAQVLLEQGLQIHRQGRAGMVHYHLLVPLTQTDSRSIR